MKWNPNHQNHIQNEWNANYTMNKTTIHTLNLFKIYRITQKQKLKGKQTKKKQKIKFKSI